jgi:hypothetical protein
MGNGLVPEWEEELARDRMEIQNDTTNNQVTLVHVLSS